MDLSQPYALLLLLCSPFIGSFIGVLADRLGRGESAIVPRSACRACGTRLGPRDLVPLLSFLAARGRCRHCNAAIPAWLLYVEILATGMAVFALILAPTPLEAWLSALFLWLLLALALCDLQHFRLPDPLTAALLVSALALAWVSGAPRPAQALIGAVAGAGSFLALRLAYHALRGREGLGLGDVKLMAGLGAALGWSNLALMVLLAALASLAAALAGALAGALTGALTGTRAAPRPALDPARPLPFGAALCAATGILWAALRLTV